MNKRYGGVVRHLISRPGTALRSYELLPLLGLKAGAAIPATADFKKEVMGVLLHVRPKTKRGMEKRVYAQCPDCGEWLEAGHLHQHTEAKHMERAS